MSDMQRVYQAIALEVQQKLAELYPSDSESSAFLQAGRNPNSLQRKNRVIFRNSRKDRKVIYEHL